VNWGHCSFARHQGWRDFREMPHFTRKTGLR
jgi:hypothetical protein